MEEMKNNMKLLLLIGGFLLLYSGILGGIPGGSMIIAFIIWATLDEVNN